MHELTCHSRSLYMECKDKMRFPPIPVDTRNWRHLAGQNGQVADGHTETLQHPQPEVEEPDLIAFD
ncbi:unnamed protein product [Gongylonema pulchrum]|uniref:Uncharacterized protein n=1 Tax=Gongylonema pulchrum TaxID=637853 RepID=A0A3P7MWH4_9BILA|nr:unnamed protein product [Gongylonema pulchrum]